MKIKLVSVLLCCMMVLFVFAGCGSQEEKATEETTTSEQTVDKQDTQKEDTKTTETVSKEKKKIVIVQEDDVEVRLAKEANILAALEKGGFLKDKNAEITEIKMGGDQSKSEAVVNQIKELKPDVAIINVGVFAPKMIALPLADSGIPVVLTADVGNKAYDFVDENSKPKKNVTGVYISPKDLQANAFSLLQQIIPANGKKAVFITNEGYYTKDGVANNLKALGVELKDFCESKFVEDFQAAVKKYNDDSEVAWMLVGVWPSLKKDGTSQPATETTKWDIANRKKPSVTYWASACEKGILCALGVDLPEAATQAGELAVKILGGEKIENVNAVYPRKTSIVLNQKRADMLKIQFPGSIMGSASKVYDKTILDPK